MPSPTLQYASLIILLAGCGARTGLGVPQRADAGRDVSDASDGGGFAPLLVADGRHACYRSREGTLLCWGGSPNGEVGGDGGWLAVPRPQAVPTNGVPIMVSAHYIGQCILLADGTVDCWGYDDQFQRLGDGSGKPQTPPGVAVLKGATALISSPHGDFECARRADHALYCWGYPPDCDPTYPDAGYPATPAPRPDLGSLDSVALGQQFLCGTRDTSVYCCGHQTSGVLGNGAESSAYHPALAAVLLPPGTKVQKAFVGLVHACALVEGGTAWCWGWNSEGQVGDGTKGTDRSTPVKVAGLTDAVQLALGDYHSCARLADGTAVCWGANTHGQLGDGTTDQHLTPTPVVSPSGDGRLSGIVDLHAGYDFSCALLVSGDVYCWGWNDYGQLGDGTTADRDVPTRVVGLP